jgi:hypothetical protein
MTATRWATPPGASASPCCPVAASPLPGAAPACCSDAAGPGLGRASWGDARALTAAGLLAALLLQVEASKRFDVGVGNGLADLRGQLGAAQGRSLGGLSFMN